LGQPSLVLVDWIRLSSYFPEDFVEEKKLWNQVRNLTLYTDAYLVFLSSSNYQLFHD